MNTLSVDIGNSSTKVDSWSNDGIIGRELEGSLSLDDILRVVEKSEIKGIIVSTVRNDSESLIEGLREKSGCVVVEFNEDEFRRYYDFSAYKGHLGPDRAAAYLGAELIFPDTAKLIVDAGTALTIDVVDSMGKYRGGNISMGFQSRLKALANATSRLPEIDDKDSDFDCCSFGNDTYTAIRFGAANGLRGEVVYSAYLAKGQYDIKMVILTGGDADKIYFPDTEYERREDRYLVGRGLDYHLRSRYLQVPVGCPSGVDIFQK